MPRDDRIEALVQLDVGMHRVQADRVAELPEPRDRGDTFARGQVVEDRLGHEQVRRRDVVLSLELGHPERGVEREVDVVAEEQVSRLGALVEGREAVSALLRRLEDLGIVRQVEGAAQLATTSTWSRLAAVSARRSASSDVSAIAIT